MMRSGNLPAQLTSFVGRASEAAQVRALVTTRRLVTLAGTGGCGKTRLAVRVAGELAGRWPDGAWWVDLGSIADPAIVAELTGSTLQVLVDPTAALASLIAQLTTRRMLLCLDNCEHLVEACAELVRTVLGACPGVTVLATSREPLGVPGETVWRVPSLLPGEAVALFADRAELVRPGFPANTYAETIADICQRLDGIPLAIELAAAWVRVLSPVEIAAGVKDRFRLLTSGAYGTVARHRTLASSMAWSHDLLDEQDQVLFRRLAVFSGGFTLEAAGEVCAGDGGGDLIPAIGRLVDKSLVIAQTDGPATRFRLLETVRQYAEDRLVQAGEVAAVRDRHLDYYLGFAEQGDPQLELDQDRWRAVLNAERGNLRAALGWGLEAPDPGRGRRLASALARYWFLHGHSEEGLGFLHRAVDRVPDDRTGVQSALWSGIALLELSSARVDLVDEAAGRGLAVATAIEDDRGQARCLALRAYASMYSDFAATDELIEQACRYGERAGDLLAVDLALTIQASLRSLQGRHAEAHRLGERLYQRVAPRGVRLSIAFALEPQAYAALFTGDVRKAVDLAARARDAAVPLGDYFTVSHITNNLAWILALSGDLDGAWRTIEPVVRSTEAAGLVEASWLALAVGTLHLAGGDFGRAVEWLRRSATFLAPTEENWASARALPGLAHALRMTGQHDQARQTADRALAISRKLGAPDLVAAALEQLAFLAEPDSPWQAEELQHQALAVRVEHDLRTFYADSLDALADLAAAGGSSAEAAAAARLLAASGTARHFTGYPRPRCVRPAHDAVVAAVRAALGEEPFAEAWAAGSRLSLDEAVDYATRARGRRRRPASGWASLTPTELRVAELVVLGLTNPQIAARTCWRSSPQPAVAPICTGSPRAGRSRWRRPAGIRATSPLWPCTRSPTWSTGPGRRSGRTSRAGSRTWWRPGTAGPLSGS